MSCGRSLLITGGCGFIGSHLAEVAVADGWGVTILDTCHEGSVAQYLDLLAHSSIDLVERDVTVPAALEGLPRPDAVVHAAAFLGVRAVTDDPLKALDINIQGTRNVALWAAEDPTCHLVYLSTSEVYGAEANLRDETEPAVLPTTGSRWSYAVSKLAGEHYVEALRHQQQSLSTIIRPFNVYGARRQGRYALGEFVRRALGGEDLIINGTGQQTRSWCHVSDFCSAALAVLDNEDAHGQTFNIGNPGAHLTVTELAELVIELAESDSRIVHADPWPDVLHRRPNVELANHVLGYAPQVGIREGLLGVIAHQPQVAHGYRRQQRERLLWTRRGCAPSGGYE